MSAAFTKGPWAATEYGYEKHGIADERGAEIGFTHRRGDARLISAAPELFEALEAVDLARMSDAPEDWQRATDLSDAALAKARGEAL